MMTGSHDAGQFTRRGANVPPEEWLGGESHVPGMNRELRRRHRSTNESSLGWVVFSIFVAGFALGSVISLLSNPRRVSS